MTTNYQSVTEQMDFFQGANPFDLITEFGTPLYVYNERILRENCRKMKGLVDYPNFRVNYSVKANSNLALLQIVREEGLDADAMSPGEIFAELAAGFEPSQIFYISNNVSSEEMRFARDKGVLTSVDSLSQLELFGKTFPGERVAVRFNPGVGAGHHAKVTTGGKNTKFGIDADKIGYVKELLKRYNLRLVGINHHIGSLFMDAESYITGAQNLANIARNFDNLEFIDLGGGFGIPYNKLGGQPPLDTSAFGKLLNEYMHSFAHSYGNRLQFKIEPGRFITCESGIILSLVNSTKDCYGTKYIGTDIGFNVLMRPAMYDAHHDIEVFSKSALPGRELVTVVGNICETGDILANPRELPKMAEGDIICVLDAGAYGMSMASNYNLRQLPAELLIRQDNTRVLIRKRDTLDDMLRNQLLLQP